jgi:uncharacterized protein YjbI with pentapeptide repeats
MNKYVRKLLGVMFQSKQTQHIVRIQSQHLPASSEEWRVHWQEQGQPWRTEPELDAKRQKELSKHRMIVPDTEKGIYPFKGMRLSRADVEWLLATHENGRGPIDWDDESQRKRKGLDLRGADLRVLNLSGLPLARIYAGTYYWSYGTDEQFEAALVHLEGASLVDAHLEGAFFAIAHLEDADFSSAYLQDATLTSAHLEKAWLSHAYLENANLRFAHLEGASLTSAHLERANLSNVFFDHATRLNGVVLGDKETAVVSLVDIYWGDANLAVVKWSQMNVLGDEYEARQKWQGGKRKTKETLQESYETAVRANRQVATALQNQGLNEDAARFAYRAQILQRKVLWKQRDFGKWFFSLLLALLAGYGYRMGRIIIAYLLVIFICAVTYFALGMYYTPHLSLAQAFLESITAFHGRVFLELFASDTPQIWVTAFEAVAGLVIEGVFIAMLTQRFFGK